MAAANAAQPSGSSYLGSLEAENELRMFLTNARPEWSKPRRHGRSDIARVIHKFRAIGIVDIRGLMKRVKSNKLNADLHAKGFVPLSKEALDAILEKEKFLQALDTVDVPNIRQVGKWAPVTQLLTAKRLIRQPVHQRHHHHDRSPQNQLTESRSEGTLRVPQSTRLGLLSEESEPLRNCIPHLRGVNPMRKKLPQLPQGTWDLSSLPWPPLELEMARTGSADWELDGDPSSPTRQMTSSSMPPDSPSRLPSSRPRTLARTTSGGLAQQEQLATPDFEELIRLWRSNTETGQNFEDRVAAKWSLRSLKCPLELGEEMLKEQLSLDNRIKLNREMHMSDPSVEPDPMRAYVAKNIKMRMFEDIAGRKESTEGLALQQQCLNIRKHLASMMNSRKELAGLRSRVQSMLAAEASKEMAATF